MVEASNADISESQALRRTTRTRIVPERAQQEAAERAEKRAQYERHLSKQKRKAFAEARDQASAAADDDDESSDEGGSPKRARKAGRFDDSLLMQPYDQITNDLDRNEWLLAAIYRRDGDDLRNSGLSREELKELWEKTDDGPEAQVDHYPGIKIDREEHRVAEGRAMGAPLPRLQSTDSTTVGFGKAMLYRGARTPNGKLVPIEGGNAAGSRDSADDHDDVGGGGANNMASRNRPADRSASSGQVNGYANGFRVTPVPQPKRCGKGRAPAPQSALRLSAHSSSQPSRDQRDATPRRPSNSPPLVLSRRSYPNTPTSARRASVPAGSSRRDRTPNGAVVPLPSSHARPSAPANATRSVRASSTPNQSPRAPATRTRSSSVPRRAEGPIAGDDIRVPSPQGGDTDLEGEPNNGFGQDESGGNGQLFFDDDGDGGDGGGWGEDDEDVPDPGQPTRRQLAQLSQFGIAKPLVQELNRRVKLLAITKCAYADVLPCLSEPDGDGNRQVVGVKLDFWIIREWAEVNKAMRPNQAPLPLLESYCTYVKDDFSGVRNHLKNVLQVLVPGEYGFVGGFSEENVTKSKDLLPDAFHSSKLQQPDNKRQFRHKIIVKGIKGAWFASRRAIGFKNAAKFRPMPLGTIAFVCTMIHFLISDFSSGEQQLSKLDAEHQSPWFERYLEALEDMGKQKNCPFRLTNIQREAFDQCHGRYHHSCRPKIQPAVVEYGTDSEEEYTYVS